MVHVACAIMLYFFWFEKTFDIRGNRKLEHPNVDLQSADARLGHVYKSHGNLANFSSSALLSLEQDHKGGSHYYTFSHLLEHLKGRVYLFLVQTLVPAIYGSIHLLAWDFNFPTQIEALLWKVSSLAMVLTMPACIAGQLLMTAVGQLFEAFENITVRNDVRDKLLVMVMLVLEVLLYGTLGAGILYIVVESFVSLRAVPLGVYYTPSWIQMIPHF
ncbi:hypothetical protein QC761_0050290 [Podospora bellae-mahoneyi]|uniref:Uncharacterized protein n=1 Tax=Podospora bellae-mahoneyi TaxID=2093777 RepID=A0ABR0FK63_9PEZI|nr:hypothetical protein QC761_0050290 [Podospora bellae-mahoneyi]